MGFLRLVRDQIGHIGLIAYLCAAMGALELAELFSEGSPARIGLASAVAVSAAVVFFEYMRWFRRKLGLVAEIKPGEAWGWVHLPTFKNGIAIGFLFVMFGLWGEQAPLWQKAGFALIIAVPLAFICSILAYWWLRHQRRLDLAQQRRALRASQRPAPPRAPERLSG